MQSVKFPFRMYNKNTMEWDAIAYGNIPESGTSLDHFKMFEGWLQQAIDGGAILIDEAKLKELGIPNIKLTAESLFQKTERLSNAYI